MSLRTKQKLLNLVASLVLAIYPLFFAVSVVYAAPRLPGTPQTPSTPSLPGTPETPDTPRLPGQEEPSDNPTGSGDQQSGPQAGGQNASNSNTGSDSNNDAETNIDNNSDANINNEAGVDNIVSVDSLTGGNDADKNTGDGVVSTGRAGISSSLSTNANHISLRGLECSTECEVISLGDLNSSNSNTGSGSDNTASTGVNNSNSTGIDNDAEFNNLVDLDANSGDNSASKNTGDGIITTGDAEIILTAINTANNINVGYEVFNVYDDQTGDIVIDYDAISSNGSGSGICGDATSTNDTTGSGSTNTAATACTNQNTILIDNDGNIINNYQIDANTGNNTADLNTGNGVITTGDANIVFNLINFLNNVLLGGGELLLGVVNIFGTLSGDIVLQGLDGTNLTLPAGTLSASNSTTGADSLNNAITNATNTTDITLANSVEVLNNVTLDATTGNNDASKNTGSGSITTGDTNANLKVTNIANTNTIGNGGGTIWMVLVNNLGTWTGQLFDGDASSGIYSPFFTFTINPDGSFSASNTNTDADSTNNANTIISNDTDITITNTATLTNNVMIDANTGGNSASKNTGSGTILTGNVNIAANIINILNNNFIGGRFILTIVNVFGSFLGDIRQAHVGTGTAEITVDPGESIAVSAASVTSSPNVGWQNGSRLAYSATNSQGAGPSPDENSSNSLVAGFSNPTNQTAYFVADPGLFDGFKLYYLLIPVLAGVLVSLVRRAWVRR